MTCQHYLKKETLTQLKSNKNDSKKEWDRIRKKSRVNVLVEGIHWQLRLPISSVYIDVFTSLLVSNLHTKQAMDTKHEGKCGSFKRKFSWTHVGFRFHNTLGVFVKFQKKMRYRCEFDFCVFHIRVGGKMNTFFFFFEQEFLFFCKGFCCWGWKV